MNNLHNNIVYLLDEFAPYRKISKKEFKLKAKPWINNEIIKKIRQRDNLLHKYHKSKDANHKKLVYQKYKYLRNNITKLKRDAKKKYYKEYFEFNRSKIATIWKGIKSIVKIKATSRKDITLTDDDGKDTTNPSKIANIFNNFFVNIGPEIDKTIPTLNSDFQKYLTSIDGSETFFLIPTFPNEIFDIINLLNNNKALGPNTCFYIKNFQFIFF